MQLEEVSSDAITFILGFQACNDIESTDKAQEIHSQLVKRGFFETNVVIGKSLLDICAKCGLVVETICVFKSLPVKDVVLWTSLITRYAIFIVIVDYFVYCPL